MKILVTCLMIFLNTQVFASGSSSESSMESAPATTSETQTTTTEEVDTSKMGTGETVSEPAHMDHSDE